MKIINYLVTALILAASGVGASLSAQQVLNADLADEANRALLLTVPTGMQTGKVAVEGITADTEARTIIVNISAGYADVPFTRSTIDALKQTMRNTAGPQFADYDVQLNIAGNAIENYLPQYDSRYARESSRFVTDAESQYEKGLSGKIIAMWQSHGWYFEPKLNRWEWQRARVWQTVEDLYTQSYVVPYLMPMLENAGAYVMSPRERDMHSTEVIVDNDAAMAQNGYSERHGSEKWRTGSDSGFAYRRAQYVGYENPFAEGSYREVRTTRKSKHATTAHWDADMPQAGTYAIYVSYKSLPQSVSDATYVVNSLAGRREIKVNQRMGGGTWIYLGKFPLQKGHNADVVTLSNVSDEHGVVTADAVKIGGGMGNVSRRVEPPVPGEKMPYGYDEAIDYKYQPSRYPRFTEGARYWLQWAGAPDSVYSLSHLTNDYNDDFRSRAEWVNWLAGGSQVLPERRGLGIPVDMAFAFHSDAGTTPDDRIIGTLGIYMTNKFGNYADGTPRNYSRLLTDAVMTNVVNDIRAQYEPQWTRRGMWDKSYYEARVPEVPTMLLELLSHHNFADMKYGLDPTFRFAVSRAIYKGILQFLANRDGREFEIQPLPVNSFAITPVSGTRFRLQWKATPDTLTKGGAMPCRYIVEQRVKGDAFRRVAIVENTYYEVSVQEGTMSSYRIIAENAGGRSFPSEVLAVGVASQSKGMVMVVNGFTRLSAPSWFETNRGENQLAGFTDKKDSGVPYVEDISYVGPQFEFRRSEPWHDDDSSGFGASDATYETQVTAGNTYDYAAMHGEAIMAAGYSFVSASMQSVADGLPLSDYCVADFIFGKQRETRLGRGAVPNRYKIFTPAVIKAISDYTAVGGNVLVSGSYVASDIWDRIERNEAETDFARKVLGYRWRMSQAEASGSFYSTETAIPAFKRGIDSRFATSPNARIYSVESPDGILPSGKNGITILKYTDNNMSAAVASDMGTYRSVVAGFPLETVEDATVRNLLMKNVLNYLTER